MKTLLHAVIIITVGIAAHSQTVLQPLPVDKLTYHGDSINFNNTALWAPMKQTRFYFGWQWSGPNRATNERLHANFQQNGTFTYRDPNTNKAIKEFSTIDTSVVIMNMLYRSGDAGYDNAHKGLH